MDTCSRASRAHISKERKMDKSPGRVEPTSQKMESPNLKTLRKRDIVQRARLKGLPPFTLIHPTLSSIHILPSVTPYLRMSYTGSLSFIWKMLKNPRMIVDQRIWDILLDLIVLSFICTIFIKRLCLKVEGKRHQSCWGELGFENHSTFEVWKRCSNSWSCWSISLLGTSKR
jgi:hypothetical protein